MKKRLLSLFLIIALFLPCFALASDVVNIDYEVDGDSVCIIVKGQEYKPVSIVIEDAHRKYYIDQKETDSGGEAVFTTRLEKGKEYNCIVNVAGVRETRKILINDDEPGEPKPEDVAYISVKGYKGTILPRVQVKLNKGDTVLSLTERVLSAEGIDYKIRNGYIAGIDGQNEFDKGPGSGWMFSVNGKFPTLGVDSVVVKNGDLIEWFYTSNLGDDIGNSYGGEAFEEEEVIEDYQFEVSTAIESIVDSIAQKEDLTEWQAIGLLRAGINVDERYYENLVEYVRVNEGNFRKMTDYGKIALAATALKKDPRNISGYNIIEKIYNNDKMTLQGTNGPIFALIALDSAGYPVPNDALWPKKKLVNWIIDQQNDDGGFSLVKGETSDIDITAMALQALSRYRDISAVKTAVERAVTFLSENQSLDGGFCSWEESNSESISQTIIALTALGIDPANDSRFVKEGNLISKLLSFREPDGRFAHLIGEGPDDMATEQVLVALVAYQRFLEGKQWIFDMTEEKAGQSDFVDMALASEWAREYIIKAKALGLMEGKGHDRFEPKQNLTRAEFATILVRLLDEEPLDEVQQVFVDVEPSNWHYGYVMIAYKKGFVLGKSVDKFFPGDCITREEMAVMLQRALSYQASSDVCVNDIIEASVWAVPSIYAVMENGLMIGDNGYFFPKQNVTREMAAAVVVRVYEQDIAD
ncbi:MAG: S-layer homology domain-containing protein [Tepidanaerobacteraceae bacterium]